MVIGIGIDLIEIARVECALERRRRLLGHLFSAAEITYCQERKSPAASFAARFAAKEAVRKSCSTTATAAVMPWSQVEILVAGGKPFVRLSGQAAAYAAQLGIVELQVSLTHSRDYASAVVLALGADQAKS
jgi:holo-[acyl-carrier protein] synthase